MTFSKVSERYLTKEGVIESLNDFASMFHRRSFPGRKTGAMAILLMTIACILWSATAFSSGTNLVVNPGFEEGKGFEPFFWQKGSWAGKGRFGWDSSVEHSGSRSVSITNAEADDSRYKQIIHVKGDSYYKFSCFIKTENVGANAKGANLSFEGLTDTSPDVKGTSEDWKLVEIYGRTDKNQESITLTLGLGGYGSVNTGSAWFDDVVAEQVDSLPPGVNAINLFVSPAQAEKPGQGSSASLWMVLGIITFLFAGGLIYFIVRTKGAGGPAPGGLPATPLPQDVTRPNVSKTTFDKKDFAIMASMSLFYMAIALINLGSMNVPETPWDPKEVGASFVVDPGREINLSRISFYCALGTGRDARGKYIVESIDDPGKPVLLGALEKNTVFAWKFIDVSAKARKLKFIVDDPSGTIDEIGLFENGGLTPLKDFKVVENTPGSGNVEKLFDEQKKVAYSPSYLNGTYFDEIYYPRTAYEYLHGVEPFENTHPPLGKLLIALGIEIFGMSPFGWRIVGTLFGVAMVPLMYAFGKKLFEDRIFAFCAAFLMMFDFMHFTLTRIATIDVYGTFFIILMYYFMFDYYVNRSYLLSFRQSLKPLFFCGLSFGFGLASKWIALYGGAGLAVLFILAKYYEYRDYSQFAGVKKAKKPAWVKDYVPLYLTGTVFFCLLFFIAIPVGIYILSYIPFMMTPGPGHGLQEVISSQLFMYQYHSTLKETHPFSSAWYEWPLMIKPLWLYGGGGLPAGESSTIVLLGNPAIWWVGIPAVLVAMIISFIERNRKMVVVFLAMAFQYVPWMLVTRITFIYHFFSCIPFVMLSIVYVMRYLILRNPVLKYFMWGYLGVVAGLFVLYYPVLSGMEVSTEYVNSLKLLKGWIF
jgi:dolichyl-phosphate-mannose-protein mannosyltransferase